MTQKFRNGLLVGVAYLGLTTGLAQAQTPGDPGQSERRGGADRNAKMAGHNMSVTGCLQKDEKEKGEYMITGEDGKSWGVKSTSVKLEDHVNHKVTVTGKVTKEGHETEAGDLNVTNLKMVSETCQ